MESGQRPTSRRHRESQCIRMLVLVTTMCKTDEAEPCCSQRMVRSCSASARHASLLALARPDRNWLARASYVDKGSEWHGSWAAVEAARSSTRGDGWVPSGWASLWECRAARGRQARAEEAQGARWGAAKAGTLTMP